MHTVQLSSHTQHSSQRCSPHEEADVGTDLLTARQVTERLGVDKSTVYRMADDGRLPAVRIGRQWRFPAAEVAQLLQTDGREEAAFDTAAAPLRTAAAAATLEAVAASLGVMMVLTDMEGHPLTAIANPCACMAEQIDDPSIVQACALEWREMADDLEFTPRFRTGHLGFQCARAFIRSGSRLVGMVLAGGVPPPGTSADGLWDLDEAERAHVLQVLPRVAAAFSHLAGHHLDHDPITTTQLA
jgi:excisionase family DNA binding protein